MQISEYFEKAKGRGVMATADSTGNLTAAVYAKPHFFGENSIAFIMADRLTHQNLQSNPHAVYLFMESGEGYAGKRLYLTQTKEEKDSPLIDQIQRRERCPAEAEYQKKNRFPVFFAIERVLPLIGEKA